ncbi:hypothetical protein COT48_03750 [Candidatus Woesearchaeota archaeon CG08_land_8_20_14_0_20_47_9]|nr:MAG: hypothetical protein AUJ69_00120 [Candidatus Woesearchaeota archaeon CG1_02_47_18]PIO03708.1 MAG: hypothetical protein COT48_03750 [Candidatus Woesearchaeota archaeon CG08_land_8_20_14_0_20_47_9]HII29891.1 hypothetical protein [Candidatus Woesearchaeota archaeon]
MGPEKDIVNLWLNRAGFFTVRNINAGKNRVVGIVALKQDGTPKVAHVEVSYTASKPSKVYREELVKRFESAQVIKTVKDCIRRHVGKDIEYERILISTTDFEIEGVKRISFSRVLEELISWIDRKDYDDAVIRSLQIFKYAVLKKPRVLANIVKITSGRRSQSRLIDSLCSDKVKKLPIQGSLESFFGGIDSRRKD